MPQETKSKDAPQQNERAESLQGLVVTREDERALLRALEDAFDYRGDVTLTLTDGERVEGYVFDRVAGPTLGESYVRLLPAASEERRVIAFSSIAQVEFSGKDSAAGKSFENWIKRYVEKKLAGEKASIESEALD